MRSSHLLTFIFILLSSLQMFAQEKPRALKFDEFDDVVENQFYSVYSDRRELTFTERVQRFFKQLEKERGAAVYIIYYQARIIEENSDWRGFVEQAKRIKNQIEYNDRIKVEDVQVIDGGYRERNTIEFWIVPKNAEPPAPTPTLNKSETFVCRNINVYSDIPLSESENDTIKFSVSSFNLEGMSDYSLTWKVSAGEIVEGQGTDKIKIKLNDSAVMRVTAFVEVGGLPYPCPKVFSATGELAGKLRLVDNYGPIANGETRARLDRFLTIMWNNPTAKGYITVYGNRAERGRDVARIISLINNQFKFRNADVSRITISHGGFREEVATELWISFDEAEKPIPTPTVDEKFVVVPRPTTKPRPRKR